MANPSDPDPIPLEPDNPAPRAAPPPRPEPEEIPVARAKPLLDLEQDSCPRCGAALEPDQVLCMKCGYDQRSGTVVEPRTGAPVEREAGDGEAPSGPEFVEPGRGSAKTLAMVGAGLTLAAMIAAAVTAPYGAGAMLVVGLVLLTLYEILVYSAAGVVAVAVAARLAEERFTRVDLGAARMFVAFALFKLVQTAGVPLGNETLSNLAALVLAGGLYFVTVLVLFRRDSQDALRIMAAHFILWLVLNLGVGLASWVHGAILELPPEPPPPAPVETAPPPPPVPAPSPETQPVTPAPAPVGSGGLPGPAGQTP